MVICLTSCSLPDCLASEVMSNFIQRLPPSSLADSPMDPMSTYITLFTQSMRVFSGAPAMPLVAEDVTVRSMAVGFQAMTPVVSVFSAPAPMEAGVDMLIRTFADLAAAVFLYAAASTCDAAVRDCGAAAAFLAPPAPSAFLSSPPQPAAPATTTAAVAVASAARVHPDLVICPTPCSPVSRTRSPAR